MLIFNRHDLTKKTDRQLTALFQDASKGLAAKGADLAAAQIRVAMIRAEIANRRLAP